MQAQLRVVRGTFTLDVKLALPSGVSALFGRSGSGKTTILRCLAGLEHAPQGVVRVADSVWQDRDGRFVPTHARGVGYVFQEAELMPHLNAREHLHYALKRAPRQTLPEDEVVRLLRLSNLLNHKPRQLSGGERQRVAMASALLSDPAVLLMDEPLSSLDEVGRNELLPYIEAVGRRLSVPVIYVSHSLREVARLADYVVWIDNGRVRDSGTPEDVFSNLEFARWRGDDAGVVVKVRVRAHDVEYGATTVESPWGELWLSGCKAAPDEQIRLRILASDVSIARVHDANTSIMNQLPARIVQIDETESDVLVRMTARSGTGPALLARITRLSRDRLELQPGLDVFAWIKAVAILQ